MDDTDPNFWKENVLNGALFEAGTFLCGAIKRYSNSHSSHILLFLSLESM
jgi:hypothetical protein